MSEDLTRLTKAQLIERIKTLEGEMAEYAAEAMGSEKIGLRWEVDGLHVMLGPEVTMDEFIETIEDELGAALAKTLDKLNEATPFTFAWESWEHDNCSWDFQR